MTDEERTRIEQLEVYVGDLRRSVHGMNHTMYLLGKPGGNTRCTVCGNLLTGEPGWIE